jgi:predicted nucleic acid-binding protein
VNSRVAVVDTSALYATVDASDHDHQRCRETLATGSFRLVVPAMVVAEASYLVATHIGPTAEADFLAGMDDFVVEAPLPDEWDRIAELVRRYRNFPLGGTDASVIVLAERLHTDLLITLDRRHFAAVRPQHAPAFRILPE